MVHIGARDGYTLGLTAGKLMRIAVLFTGQTDRLQHFRHQRLDGGPACADHLQREGDVLPHRLVVQQFVILEDEANGTTVERDLTWGQPSQIVAGDADLAIRGFLFTKQQAQQRGFAGAGCAHQKDEIASIDGEVDIIQCRTRALRIDFAYVIERDQRHRGSPLRYASASSAAARRCS